MGPTGKPDLGSADSISPGHAPLITKVLNRLVAMGKAKPKTVSSLSKALQSCSCTSIIPYTNPLDVLAIVNDQSDKPAPQVGTEQAAPVYTRVDEADNKFWELAEHDRMLTGQHFQYPPPAVKKVLLKRVWKFLQSRAEGTEESLLYELYQVCKTEHSAEPREIIENLQQMGFVDIKKGGVVRYRLPRHTDVLLLKGVLGSQLDVVHLCTRMRGNIGGYVHQLTCHNNSYYKWNPYSSVSNGVKETFRVGKTTFPFEVDLADVQALFMLDGVNPKARPKEVSDLLEFIKPACTYLHLLIPAQVFSELRGKLKQRPVLKVRITQTKKRGLMRVKASLIEFVIGTEKQKKTIPLTPEGLLGLDGVSPRVDGYREYDEQELESVGRSRQFASMMQSHLTPFMQSQRAVLFEVTDDQRSEILNKVSKWIDSYRLPDNATEEENNEGKEDEEEAPSVSEIETKPSIVKLQRELISICSMYRVTRLPIETAVALLENYGFISVDEDNSISYNIPDVSAIKDNAPYWQLQANEYRNSSVEKCYSRFLYRYFPTVRGRRRIGGHQRGPEAEEPEAEEPEAEEPVVIFARKPILSTKMKHFLFGFVFFCMIAFVSLFSYCSFLGEKQNEVGMES